MKQRLLATLTSLCLLVGLMPSVALATNDQQEETTLSITSTDPTEDMTIWLQNQVDNSNGSKENPAIIEIRDSLELTTTLKIPDGKYVEIVGVGNNITISPANSFTSNAFATALIEVGSTETGEALLNLKNITLDGNEVTRGIAVHRAQYLNLNNVVIKNGRTGTAASGGAIMVSWTSGSDGPYITMTDVEVFNCQAGLLNDGQGKYGGVINMYATGSLTLHDVNFHDNAAAWGGSSAYNSNIKFSGSIIAGKNDLGGKLGLNNCTLTLIDALSNNSEIFISIVSDQNIVVSGTVNYKIGLKDLEKFSLSHVYGSGNGHDLTDKYTLYLDVGTNAIKLAEVSNVVSVTLNGNSGEGTETAPYKVVKNQSATLPSAPFSRTGYIFAGWNTASDGTGTPYADGATLTSEVLGEGLTLYAQWISGDAVLASGSCGAPDKDAVVWKFTADGTLTISGSGAMADYASKDTVPWGNYLNQIKTGVVESGITHLGARTFVLAPNLNSVELPDSLISIGESAFNQSGLTSLELPQNLKTIGKNAFWHGNLSGKLNIPESVETIGDFAFDQNKLTEVNLPTGLKTLGAGAFKANPLAAMPEIPLGITSLTSTFQNCTELKEIDIPSHVTTLDKTFMGCTGLTTVTIPETVESYIGLFNGCTNLTSAVIESKATDIGGKNDNNAYGVFGGCSSLESVVVPEHVTVIGIAAFKGCSKLKTTDFIERATSIGSGAFQGCTELQGSLNLNASAIGSVAFDGCTGLGPDISIANATTVGDYAFRSCSSLTGIVYAQKISGGANLVSGRSVTALLNGGTFMEGTKFTAGSLADPIKDSYIFDGWYTQDGSQSNDWGEKVDPAIVGNNTTYYAKWTASAYSVSTEPVDFGSITYGSAVEAKTITITGNGGSSTLTAVSSNKSVFTATASGSEVTVAPKTNLDVGTYSEVVTITTPDNATFSVPVTITITKAEQSLTITPSVSSLTGGGTVTLTVTKTGLPQDAQVSVSGYSNIINNGDGTYTVTLPNSTATYTFTASYAGDINHEAASATCTVSVTQYTGGGGSSSGGSSSSNVSGSGDSVSISASGGTVTDAQMESAVKKADKGSTITIKATSSTTVTLPVGGMADAADNDNDVLLDLRYGEVTLSARAIAGMTDGVSSNDKIKVSVANQTSSKDETISDLLDKGAAVFDVTVEVDGVEIHSFDGTLTITLTVSNLSKISDPHVLHILNNGTKEYYTPDRISGNTITVTGIRNLSTFAVIPGSEVPQTNPFTDVRTSDYYYDAVLWAADNGVTGGTSATTFSPNVTVTRAQMVTFLWRAHGSPKATGANPFTDVSTSDYYYDAVLWAVANGVTSGTSADTFGPDAAVTRAQAVTFQWRAAGSPVVSGSSFDDVAADAYYANAVAWAVANGITSGTGGSNFSPDVVVTRAQAVTFLWKELA